MRQLRYWLSGLWTVWICLVFCHLMPQSKCLDMNICLIVCDVFFSCLNHVKFFMIWCPLFLMLCMNLSHLNCCTSDVCLSCLNHVYFFMVYASIMNVENLLFWTVFLIMSLLLVMSVGFVWISGLLNLNSLSLFWVCLSCLNHV